MSAVDDGAGGFSPLNSVTSSQHQPAMTPGLAATCSASSPSDIDLGCGLHESFSVGTRSRTRRVVPASLSDSLRTAAPLGLSGPPCFGALDTTYDFGFAANGPTAGFGCVLASAPSSSLTPRAIAAVSLPAWKQVKSGRSRHANGPHSRTLALRAASCTMLIARS